MRIETSHHRSFGQRHLKVHFFPVGAPEDGNIFLQAYMNRIRVLAVITSEYMFGILQSVLRRQRIQENLIQESPRDKDLVESLRCVE